MAAPRKLSLNDPIPHAALAGSRAVQDGIFATIFTFLRVLSETLKTILFPLATAISVVNLYYRIKDYPRRKKIAGERASLLSDILATTSEVVAIGLFLGIVFGAVIAPVLVPAFFIASIGLRWLNHAAQSIYWGIQVYRSKGTPEHAENRAHLNTHLRLLGVFTTAALVVGLLLFAPAAFGFALPLLAQGVIQVIGATVMAMNCLYMASVVGQVRKKTTKPNGLIKTLSLSQESVELKLDSNSRSTLSANVDLMQPRDMAKLSESTQRFTELRATFVDENLLYKMEMSVEPNGPRELVEDFLNRAKIALKASLGYQAEVKLTEAGMLPKPPSTWIFDQRTSLLRDKLHAVLLLEKLLFNGEFEIKARKDLNFKIENVLNIAFYFKYNNKDDIPNATLRNLFEAVNDFLTKPELQQGTDARKKYLINLHKTIKPPTRIP